MFTAALLLSACVFFPEPGTWPAETSSSSTLETWEAPALLLGAYSPRYLGNSNNVDEQLVEWDAEVSTPLSLGGVFIGVEDANPTHDLPEVYSALWSAGYTPFVNLASVRSIEELESGGFDAELTEIAQATAAWLDETPGGFLFFAPLPEMNGDWENYSFDPVGYRRFFGKLRLLFDDNGVRPDGVKWVFAPNGWSPSGLEFELFYPGPHLVDAVGFSAYQWGGCEGDLWQTPEEAFSPYIRRMALMAPDKPLFVSQTASTSVLVGGASDEAAKALFLEGSYRLLAEAKQVLGVMYFNIDKECDWAVWDEGVLDESYRAAVTAPGIDALTPEGLRAVLP